MKQFPEEKAEIIREYERFSKLYNQDKGEFDFETRKALDNIINQAESDERRNNLRKLQEQWNKTLELQG